MRKKRRWRWESAIGLIPIEPAFQAFLGMLQPILAAAIAPKKTFRPAAGRLLAISR